MFYVYKYFISDYTYNRARIFRNTIHGLHCLNPVQSRKEHHEIHVTAIQHISFSPSFGNVHRHGYQRSYQSTYHACGEVAFYVIIEILCTG